jgi:signal transduction histidine kinase
MVFTPRRRIVLAILAMAPIAYYYIDYCGDLALNLARSYLRGYTVCGSWQTTVTGCGPGYNAGLGWLQLIVLSAVFGAMVYGLARWAMHPLVEISDAVTRFGPTSIGLRLRAHGPRDETRVLSDSIDAMLDRLAEGYEAQRRFASNASHELRTPLATQRALIEVSLTSALTPEQLDLLSRQLLSTNERNERLVDGLLALAETERGLMAHTPVELDAVVREVVGVQQPGAAERGITVQLSAEPVTIAGERALLERLIANLVDNAIKYNEQGGTVAVWVTSSGVFAVRNTGPLVPADQAALLFEPFRRLRGERLDHGGGVGLGMTIARSIVAAHGGAIQAEANADGGLTVTVSLRPIE